MFAAAVREFVDPDEKEENVPGEIEENRIQRFLGVPFQLERVIFFGFFVCLNSFLYVFTALPFRACRAVLVILFNILRLRWASVLRFYEVSLALLCVSCCYVLSIQDLSVVYHEIRGQSVIKLYVIINVLEIFDKLCTAFGLDIFMALKHAFGVSRPVRVALHFSLAWIYLIVHSMVILYQLITLSVAVNSHGSVLLTVVISNQFMELKGSVLKRSEIAYLLQVTCSDIRERFQLFILTLLLLIRNLAALQWSCESELCMELVQKLSVLLLSEVIVDWIKHAFISRFNLLDNKVYQSFSAVLREDVVENGGAGGILQPVLLRLVLPELELSLRLAVGIVVVLAIKVVVGMLVFQHALRRINRPHPPIIEKLKKLCGPLDQQGKSHHE